MIPVRNSIDEKMAFANGPKGLLAQALSISGLSGVLGASLLNFKY
jgi:hypothetical protein